MANQRNVQVTGFELILNPQVPFNDLLLELKLLCDQEIDNGSTTQTLFLDENNGYIIGSAIRQKGHKQTIESMRDENNDLVINRTEIREDMSGIEPTLFVINPNTLKGVYYRNYGSPSLGALKRIFCDPHNKIRQKVIDEAVKKELLSEEHIDIEKVERKLKDKFSKQFSGNLEINVLATPEDLKSLLERYARVSKCEISASQALFSAPLLSPINNIAHDSKVSFSFEKKSPLIAIKNAILEVFKSDNYKALKLLGQGFNGEALEEYVGIVKEYYHTCSYDDFIDELPNSKWKEYTTSPAMIRLLDIIRNRKATFGPNPKT